MIKTPVTSRMADIKKFESMLEDGVAAFQDSRGRRALSVSHNDGDGLTASALVCKTMDFLKMPCVQLIFERSESWDQYFTRMLANFKEIDTIFITDLGAEEKQLATYFSKYKSINVFILDHHKISKSEIVDHHPDNIHSMNPTRFGLDGLRDIAGSTLTYMFCEKLSSRVKKISWLPVVGMAGDVLKPVDKYLSYNKQVLDVAVDEGTVMINEGVVLLGGMAESTIVDSLAFSILPFVNAVQGDPAIGKNILTRRSLDQCKNVLDLDRNEINELVAELGRSILGKTALITGREGLLHHSFEFNFLISIVGDDDHASALKILDMKKPSSAIKVRYASYLKALVSHLVKIASNTGVEGKTYRFFEMGPDVVKQLVSDIASFTSVNNLLTSEKILVISTKESSDRYKLSFRCAPEFVKEKNIGVGSIIEKIALNFGGRGGGHDLAGGWLVPDFAYQQFKKNIPIIDKIIEEKQFQAGR